MALEGRRVSSKSHPDFYKKQMEKKPVNGRTFGFDEIIVTKQLIDVKQ